MSTYSPDLRIELITTGDQAGTWGTTTNTNLGTLIEDAISGYITVSVTSASQAFTALNGAADEARNATIRLTTTTTAAFAVYAPPSAKLYVLWNDTSYAATVYNSTVLGNTTAAGTGVTIPAGKIMTVWSNGTNFYVQNSHVIGTVVGNVTGDLTGNVTGNVAGNVTGNVTGNLNGNLTAAAPTATTQTAGTNNTTVATTAFVTTAVSNATSALGTMATQNANNVAITGGTITGTTVNGNTVGSNSVGARTVSTGSPSGGSNGDIWYKV